MRCLLGHTRGARGAAMKGKHKLTHRQPAAKAAALPNLGHQVQKNKDHMNASDAN